MMRNTGIVFDGPIRLRKALEEEVRREFARELSSAATDAQRKSVFAKIKKEIAKRLRDTSSSQSLWITARPSIRRSL